MEQKLEFIQKETGWRRWSQNNYLKALVYGMAVSFLLFIPFILYDNGYFLFYGDFNVQQVPFYQMCHDAVRSGNIFWSWTTDLGANFIGSYTFYLLGSPFFWLTLPFPSAAVPYLMGPLFILKFGCASPHRIHLLKTLREKSPQRLNWRYALCLFRIFHLQHFL